MKATKKKKQNGKLIHRLKLQNFWQNKLEKENSHTDKKNYTWAASSDLKCLQKKKKKKYNVDFLRKKK